MHVSQEKWKVLRLTMLFVCKWFSASGYFLGVKHHSGKNQEIAVKLYALFVLLSYRAALCSFAVGCQLCLVSICFKLGCSYLMIWPFLWLKLWNVDIAVSKGLDFFYFFILFLCFDLMLRVWWYALLKWYNYDRHTVDQDHKWELCNIKPCKLLSH